MSSTYSHRFYNEPKQNNIKYKKIGQTHMLMVCLNYEGTKSPLTCIIDGKRIMSEAKKGGTTDIVSMFDDGSTDYFPNRQNVIAMMAKMSANCKPGDMFVMYYSGHGTRVEDVNQDEDDGFDEAFCLMSESGKYEFLTDDDIAAVVARNLPENIPCVFIVDACHSGSILDLTNTRVWGTKKVYSISGCQDNQYSNDTGNGGQMTNILLAVIREHHDQRVDNDTSLQFIFNRMITKNQMIEGQYCTKEEKEEAYAKLEKSTAPSLLSKACGILFKCVTKQPISTSEYIDVITTAAGFNDAPGEFQPVVENAAKGQWINMAWSGGSDPTKIPFPF